MSGYEAFGIFLTAAVAFVVVFRENIAETWRRRRRPYREELRFHRTWGGHDDPIDNQWEHRDHDHRIRQGIRDASQEVMTRLL